jgi:hypothetical protein
MTPRRSRFVSMGLWILFLTFAVSMLMGLGHSAAPKLNLRDGIGFVAFPGAALSVLLLAIGLLHSVLSPRVKGVAGAIVGLLLCGLVVSMTFRFVDTQPPAMRSFIHDGAAGAGDVGYVGRYVKPPPATFERDFLASGRHAGQLREQFGEAMPHARLVRRSNYLYVEYGPEVEWSVRSKLAIAVARLVAKELDGDFIPREY